MGSDVHALTRRPLWSIRRTTPSRPSSCARISIRLALGPRTGTFAMPLTAATREVLQSHSGRPHQIQPGGISQKDFAALMEQWHSPPESSSKAENKNRADRAGGLTLFDAEVFDGDGRPALAQLALTLDTAANGDSRAPPCGGGSGCGSCRRAPTCISDEPPPPLPPQGAGRKSPAP